MRSIGMDLIWRRTSRPIRGASLTFTNAPASITRPATIFMPWRPTAPSMAIGLLNGKSHRKGFTLVELMLVMAVMMIILSIVVPSLKGFFRGRNLDNEAMRFLALTRYGQSRAINEGVPVELWVNTKAGNYGLEALSGYTETPKK